MTFQSSVLNQMAAGFVGELYDDSPTRAEPFILNSALASYNVFGRAFTVLSEGVAQAGNPTGLAPFAGILFDPKSHALLGDSSGTLAPSLVLPNQVVGQLLNMGCVWVTLPASANIGDLVIYNNTTGVLSTIAPATPLPVGSSSAYAIVDRFSVSTAGLAVIRLTATPKIPV